MSVTAINGVLDKPELVKWAAKMGGDHYYNSMIAFAEDYKEKLNRARGEERAEVLEEIVARVIDEVAISEMSDQIRWAHRNSIRRAASIGTVAHKFAEDCVAYKLGRGPKPKLPLNKEAESAAKAFIDWATTNKVKFIDSEFRLYSKKYDFSGTVDSEVEIDGKKYICDLKTSKGIYDSHVWQISAYALARTEESGMTYDGGIIIRIDKETGQFNLLTVPGDKLYAVSEQWLGLLQAKRATIWMAECMKELKSKKGKKQ